MYPIERLSSRSKPRRFGISSRKSVSADACNSSIRAVASASWALSRRIVRLASGCGADSRGGDACKARCGATLRWAATLLGRFAPLAAVALVFFFMGIPEEEACRDSPRQDSPFRTPCHALPNLGPILYLAYVFGFPKRIDRMTASVAIIMGSQSDWATMRHAAETLGGLGVACEKHIVSAHRTPD